MMILRVQASLTLLSSPQLHGASLPLLQHFCTCPVAAQISPGDAAEAIAVASTIFALKPKNELVCVSTQHVQTNLPARSYEQFHLTSNNNNCIKQTPTFWRQSMPAVA